MQEGYHAYTGGSIDVQVTRVDDKVTLSFYRDGELLMQSDMNRPAAYDIAQKILRVLV
jgi:hypothetical protein